MKKLNGKNSIVKKIAHWHLRLSLILFFSYVALSAVYSPEFLLSDIRQKYRALADELLVVTARVLGPPEKPVVAGSAVCADGSLSINLNWADDDGSESFDIFRGGLPLVTDLTESQYADAAAIALSTSYSYIVTAYGPMGPGSADSDPVQVTTPNACGSILPSPTVAVTAFAGKSIGSYSGTPRTSDRKPDFSGTTNMPNAEISFLVSDSIFVSAQTTANGNGYWSWTPPVDLDRGNHTIFVTAADPDDPSRTASASLLFRVVKEDEDGDDDDDDTATVTPSAPVRPPQKPAAPPIPEINPLEFSLSVAQEQIFQGKELATSIRIDWLAENFEGEAAIIRYLVFDDKGEKKIALLSDATLEKGGIIRKNIPIPDYFSKGSYRVQAEIIFRHYNISRGKSFQVLEMPVLDLGGGRLVTYPELLSELGLIASILILLLLLWLILFSREYWLYRYSLRHITERALVKMGLISAKKRKGVAH